MESESSPPANKYKKRVHIDEWVMKALEEGKTGRKRQSKKFEDPDFVHPDIVMKSHETVEVVEEVRPNSRISNTDLKSKESNADLAKLNFENMTHYEKFKKYKKEYKEYKNSLKLEKNKHIDRTESTNERKFNALNSDSSESSFSQSTSTNLDLLSQSLGDGFLILSSDISKKSQANQKQSLELIKDVFCWFCHKKVLENLMDDKRCVFCCKIIHKKCGIQNRISEKSLSKEKWVCNECHICNNYKDSNTWAYYVDFLGYDKYIKQLKYIIAKQKQYPCAKELMKPVDMNIFPDYKVFVAHPVDFQMIEHRLKIGDYRCVDTLFEDFKWMLHNSIIYNGNSSAITKDLKMLVRHLRMELYDLDSCVYCYINAYTKPDMWFVLPCPKPHLLVWAQLKGFPYWPAKIFDSHIEQKEGLILVKFFGEHTRSWLPYNNVYLFSKEQPSNGLCKKNKANFTLCLEEMNNHIKSLKKKFGTFNYPDRDVLVGTSFKERISQLRKMLPAVDIESPLKFLSDKNVQDNSSSETSPIKATEQVGKIDFSDKKAQINMLSMIAKKLQGSTKSDTEDSVNSSELESEKVQPSKKISQTSMQEKQGENLILKRDLESYCLKLETSENDENTDNKNLEKMVIVESTRRKEYQTSKTKNEMDLKKGSSENDNVENYIGYKVSNKSLNQKASRANQIKSKKTRNRPRSGQDNNKSIRMETKNCSSKRKRINNAFNLNKLLALKKKSRLFRHKKFVQQMFECRKLETENSSSKYGVLGKQHKLTNKEISDSKSLSPIMNLSVNVDNLTIAQIREIKRKVKLIQNRTDSSKTLSSLLSEPLTFDKGEFIPIEDTMRLSTGVNDYDMELNSVISEPQAMDSLSLTIDQVASGILVPESSCKASNSIDLLKHPKSMTVKSKPSSMPWRTVLMSAGQNKKKRKVATMQDIIFDTQYNADLQSHELLLYAEYVNKYYTPPITTRDYDEEWEYH